MNYLQPSRILNHLQLSQGSTEMETQRSQLLRFIPSLGKIFLKLIHNRDNDVRYATLKDCQLVVKYFDLDRDNGLTFTE